MTPESKSEVHKNETKFNGESSAKNLFNSENGHSKYFKDNFESIPNFVKIKFINFRFRKIIKYIC